MEVSDYIDKAKEKLDFSIYYALSVEMGIARQSIADYRKGRRTIDEYVAFKLAEILEIDAREIIITAKSESEKNETKRKFWQALKNRQTKKV